MKILFCFLSSTLLFTNCASSQKLQANTYLQNSNLDKFQGTWRSIVNSDTIILKLVKVQYHYDYPANASADRLLGTHYFGENGRLVQSSVNRHDSVVAGAHHRATLFASNLAYMDAFTVEGLISDLSNNKQGEIKLIYVDGATPQLLWTIKNLKGPVTVSPDKPFNPYFRLPLSLTLIKQ